MSTGTKLRTRTLGLLLIAGLMSGGNLIAQWQDATPFTIAGTTADETVGNQSLAVDLTGNLHLVYQVETAAGQGWALIYRQRTAGGDWLAPEPINLFADSIPAYSPSISTSPQSLPAVAYLAASEVHVAVYGEFGFVSMPLTNTADEVYFPSITYDFNGWLHVVWVQEAGAENYRLHYAYGDGFDWTYSMLPEDLGPFGSGATPRITAEPNGVAHIIYRGGTYPDYELHHAYNQVAGGDTWSIEPIFAPPAADYGGDLEFDNAGNLHAVVFGNDGFGFPGSIYYTYRSPDSDWSDPSRVNGTYSAVEPELELDGEGIPHVIWAEVSGNFYTGNLYYSEYDDDLGWSSSLAVGDDYAAFGFVMTNDSYGHLVYGSGANSGVQDVAYIRSTSALGVPNDAPALVISPTSLDFGEVRIGEEHVRSLQFTNTGAATLDVASMTFPDGYSSDHAVPFSILPGQQQSVDVILFPTQPEEYNGDMVVLSNAASSPDTVTLTAAASPEPPRLDFDPDALEFDTVLVGADSTIVATIQNPSTSGLTIASGTISEGYESSLSFPTVVSASSEINVDVTFAPASAGIYSGFLVLISDSETSPDTLFLEGVGELDADANTPSAGMPDRFYLAQNYPNPFNPSTTISFDLPVASSITLTVHDVLGRAVRVLVRGTQSAGSHTIEWDASGLAAGLYFVRLEAPGFHATRKCMLLK